MMTGTASDPLVEGWRQLCKGIIAANIAKGITETVVRGIVQMLIVDIMAVGPLAGMQSAGVGGGSFATGGPVKAGTFLFGGSGAEAVIPRPRRD